MMRGQSCSRRPPWWPETEPWPPRERVVHWRAGRARFFRRVAVFAIMMLVAGISGVVVLVWLAATRSGIVSPTTGGAAALLVGAGLIGTVGALLIFRGIVRRVADAGGGDSTEGLRPSTGGQPDRSGDDRRVSEELSAR